VGRVCDQCSAENPALARFCCQCGNRFGEEPAPQGGGQPAGQAAAAVLACPASFDPCPESPGFYYRWETIGKESFFGCEYLGVTLFNGGAAVIEVRVRLTGRDAAGEVLFEIERNLHRMDRGQPMGLEVARHELPGVPENLDVTVVSVKRPPESDSQKRSESCQKPWWSSSWEDS
jgi:hypothetical protein